MPITKATASSIAPAAKGDLVVGSATNDASILAVGSANQVLTVDSSTTTGLKWAAAAAGGKVLQVVSSTQTGFQSVKSANNTDIPGMSVTITPSSTTSKVLITGMQNNITSQSYTVDQDLKFNLVDGANTSLYPVYKGTVNDFKKIACVPFVYLHSPNTTSAITYKLRTTDTTATDGVYFGNYGGGAAPVSSIIAMEIGA